MKLFAKLKNYRGGSKSTSDNTRLDVELRYGNKSVGSVSLYSITNPDCDDLGFRLVFTSDTPGFKSLVLAEEEKRKTWCDNDCAMETATDEAGNCFVCGKEKGDKQKGDNDCAIDCKAEHLCVGVDCKKDNPHDC